MGYNKGHGELSIKLDADFRSESRPEPEAVMLYVFNVDSLKKQQRIED
jgi:hypothetical protein